MPEVLIRARDETPIDGDKHNKPRAGTAHPLLIINRFSSWKYRHFHQKWLWSDKGNGLAMVSPPLATLSISDKGNKPIGPLIGMRVSVSIRCIRPLRKPQSSLGQTATLLLARCRSFLGFAVRPSAEWQPLPSLSKELLQFYGTVVGERNVFPWTILNCIVDGVCCLLRRNIGNP